MFRDPSGHDILHERVRSFPMLDLILLIGAVAFFALSVGYVYACERF